MENTRPGQRENWNGGVISRRKHRRTRRATAREGTHPEVHSNNILVLLERFITKLSAKCKAVSDGGERERPVA